MSWLDLTAFTSYPDNYCEQLMVYDVFAITKLCLVATKK